MIYIVHSYIHASWEMCYYLQTHLWHPVWRHILQYMWFWRPCCSFIFVPVHIYFYRSTVGFTCPNDRWMGFCIKLWLQIVRLVRQSSLHIANVIKLRYTFHGRLHGDVCVTTHNFTMLMSADIHVRQDQMKQTVEGFICFVKNIKVYL